MTIFPFLGVKARVSQLPQAMMVDAIGAGSASWCGVSPEIVWDRGDISYSYRVITSHHIGVQSSMEAGS